jgi:hypothetical protein
MLRDQVAQVPYFCVWRWIFSGRPQKAWLVIGDRWLVRWKLSMLMKG